MTESMAVSAPIEDEKARALAFYRRKLTEYHEVENRLKELRKKVSNFKFNFKFLQNFLRKMKCKRIMINRKIT